MNILPSEVESIKVIGNLHGDDVKVVKTHGGFYVAVGKKKKSSSQAEALAAGSHQALVAHQLTKEYGADFEPAIFKSEQDQLEKVEARTEYLPSEMIAKGVELYILSKGNKIDFILYKHGLTLGQYSSEIEDQTLVLKNGGFDYKEVVDKNVGTAKGIARALKEKVHELNLKGIKKGY